MEFFTPISGQIIRLNKYKKLKITRRVACMRVTVNPCNILFTNLEGKKIVV